MSTNADPNAGEVLGILMERAKVSPDHLAKATGQSKTTIYNKLDGQAWKNTDSKRYAAAFDVPAEMFLGTPVQAMLWLIEHDRFNLELIDLRDTSDLGITGSPCNTYPRSLVLAGATA